MNKKTLEALLKLIKAILNGNKPEIAPDPDIHWEALAEFVKFHEITGLVSGALSELDCVPEEIKARFGEYLMTNIYREANQEMKVQNLLAGFESAGCDCMPLKGFILKNMYPSVEMRDMCDVDILIREKDIDKLKAVMDSSGCEFCKESRHEYIYRSGITTIELHKSLVPEYNKDLYKYYGDGWRLAKKKAGSEHIYELSAEDFYIYSVVHTAKHYLNGGTGIKQVVDEYVLTHCEKMQDVDRAYIDRELKKLELEKFESALRALCEVWFGNGEYDKTTTEMADYILNSGAWGTKERADISTIYRESGNGGYKKARLLVIWNMFFPNMVAMRRRYKILEKRPYLYPVMVIRRWFEAVFRGNGGIKKDIELLKKVDDAKLDSFAEHCKAVGIKSSL